jgi:hypothetical protein
MSSQNQRRLEKAASAEDKRTLQELQRRREGLSTPGLHWAEHAILDETTTADIYNLMVKISIENGDKEPTTLAPRRERFVRTKLSEDDQQKLDKLDGPGEVRYSSNKPMLRDKASGEREQLLHKASKDLGGDDTCTEEELVEFERTRLETRSRGWEPAKSNMTAEQESSLIASMSADQQAYYKRLGDIITKAYEEGDLEDYQFTSNSRAGGLRQAWEDEQRKARAGSKRW